MDPYRVIRKPHTSEKAHEYIQEHNTYVFQVDRDATKTDIREAVKALWNVDAKSIRTLTMPAKRRRYSRFVGSITPWKKAVVRLPKDQAIEALR